MSQVLIIAEAGVNHGGNLGFAKQLIDIAAEAQVDAVKFQSFKADAMVSETAPKAAYQKKNTDSDESHYEMIQRLELSFDDHKELINYCKSKQIQFLSSPFDLESIDLLEQLNVKCFKVPSGEITNLPYLRHIGSKGKPVILSTGMSRLDEIKKAVQVLVEEGIAMEDLTLLQCNTQYPTPFQDVNLNAMLTLSSVFPNSKVGYSDHTLGIEAAIAAVGMGAKVIEKHFTLDNSLPGPDHKASLEPEGLKSLVRAIRNTELALGSSIKQPTPSEMPNIQIARKSIVARIQIKKGELLTEENLATKRPGTGICPMQWENVIGSPANRDYDKDDQIEEPVL